MADTNDCDRNTIVGTLLGYDISMKVHDEGGGIYMLGIMHAMLSALTAKMMDGINRGKNKRSSDSDRSPSPSKSAQSQTTNRKSQSLSLPPILPPLDTPCSMTDKKPPLPQPQPQPSRQSS